MRKRPEGESRVTMKEVARRAGVSVTTVSHVVNRKPGARIGQDARRRVLAIGDFMRPDRVVLGSKNPRAVDMIEELYAPLRCPIVKTDIRTAEMIKYASNAFLAAKISFINEIANICEKVGADVIDVARGMGLDNRIGPKFLNAGIGWGGSCFPKDVKALAHIAREYGTQPQLLEAVIRINQTQRMRVVEKLETLFGDVKGKRIGVLGLAFKADTDDMRESPAADIIGILVRKGAVVQNYVCSVALSV